MVNHNKILVSIKNFKILIEINLKITLIKMKYMKKILLYYN